MKNRLFLIVLITLSTINFKLFADNKDSLYVKINNLNPKLKSILIDNKGNISIFSISMKNKYDNVFRFGCNYYESSIFTKNKRKINQNNLINYYKLNEMLNKDFIKIATNYEVFFILTEDKNNFYSIKVRPLLPPELNKM